MSEDKLVVPGSAEYWEQRFHQASHNGHQGRLRIYELSEALTRGARFLESAANYQDRPGAMAEHEALAAELREVLVPPGVKALRTAAVAPDGEGTPMLVPDPAWPYQPGTVPLYCDECGEIYCEHRPAPAGPAAPEHTTESESDDGGNEK